MAKLNLGRVGFVLRGEWAQGAYSKLDVVSYGTTGDSYVSREDNNTTLPTDATKWLRLTNVGDSVSAANQAAQAANTAAASATAAAASGVRTDAEQDLNDAQKATARGNIGAASVGEVSVINSAVGELTSDDGVKPNMIEKHINFQKSIGFTATIGKFWYKSSSAGDGFAESTDADFDHTNKIDITNENGVIHIPFSSNLYSDSRIIMIMYYGTGSTYYRESDVRSGRYPEVTLNSDETEVLVDLDAFRAKSMPLQKIGFNFATGTIFYVEIKTEAKREKIEWLLVDESSIDWYENLPTYWLSTLDSIVTNVKTICRAENAVPIAFITDCHYKSAANVHGGLLHYLDDKIDFAAILNGGDFASQSTNTIETHTAEMESAMAQFDKVKSKHLPTVGNHESIHAGMSNIYPMDMTNYILHNHLSQIPGVHAGYDGNAYYYKDDGVRKIRYILLNAHQQYKTHYRVDGELVEYTIKFGYSKTQLQWLADEALKFSEDGWGIILVSHIYTKDVHVNGSESETNTNNFNILFSIIEAALAKTSGTAITGQADGENVSWDFAGNRDFDVIGYYCGHYHCDSAPFANGHVVVVPTMSANLNVWPVPGVDVTKTEGTVTETAFDILCIDRANRHVDLIRVGAGTNRSYDY